MLKSILNFFDKLEDGVREKLSRMPIVYTFIGGVAIVLFWRGVWHTADLFPFLTGPMSILISVIVLLLTGLFVSFFVGDVIIISGLKKEKKLIEKTESELKTDVTTLQDIKTEIEKTGNEVREESSELREIKKEVEQIKKSIEENK